MSKHERSSGNCTPRGLAVVVLEQSAQPLATFSFDTGREAVQRLCENELRRQKNGRRLYCSAILMFQQAPERHGHSLASAPDGEPVRRRTPPHKMLGQNCFPMLLHQSIVKSANHLPDATSELC